MCRGGKVGGEGGGRRCEGLQEVDGRLMGGGRGWSEEIQQRYSKRIGGPGGDRRYNNDTATIQKADMNGEGRKCL